MQTIKTVIHTYRFNISEDDQRLAYVELCDKLKSWPHRMKALGEYHTPFKPIDGQTIELETSHLFNNQWNTAPIEGFSEKGHRVFDWAEECPPNKDIKCGHWLEQTAEMQEIRRNTMKCGYCGKQEPAAKGYIFCPHCIDSEYLKPEDLKLTRFRAIEDSGPRGEFPELTDAEKAHLMPLYTEAQIHGSTERGKRRIASKRAALKEQRDSTIKTANIQHDGFMWLMDQGYDPSNVIYYSHTDRFCFGWRTPLSDEVLSRTLDLVCEFPFRYEIKTADGRKLENY